MVLFSQIMLVILTMIAPVIILTIFAYVKAQGWKVIAWGITVSLAVLVLVRMVIPLLFLHEGWFKALTASLPLYTTLYSLCLSLLYTAGGWLLLRRWKSKSLLVRAAAFGFSEGFAYEALFIGFNGVASLLSSHVENIGEDGIGGIWLALLEGLSMLILFTCFALWLARGLQSRNPKEKWFGLAASLGGFFVLFWAGLSWRQVWHFDRAAQELLLLVAALAAAWWIFRTVSYHSLFSVETEAEAWEYPEDDQEDF